MKNLICQTSEKWSTTTIRVVLGVVIFSHGAQAMLGWFDGAGFSATLRALTSGMGLPLALAVGVISVQFFGALMLLLGIGTRLASFAILAMFIGMITYHVEFGFHMNWMGNKTGEGFEYHVLVLAMCVVLILEGGGTWSIDRKIATRTAS